MTTHALPVRFAEHFQSIASSWFGVSSWIGLPLVFVLAFSLPVALLMAYGGNPFVPNAAEAPGGAKEESLFPEAVTIARQGVFIRVPHQLVPQHATIEPVAGEDFLLYTWINLRRLPAPQEKLILYSKYSGELRNRHGYALALSNDGEAFRPLVFWGSDSAPGAWFDFPEIQVVERRWLLFALSFHNDRYLGLHVGTAPPLTGVHDAAADPALRLLGGYDVGEQRAARAHADFIMGAALDRGFRGVVGPFAFISGHGLERKIHDILLEVLKNPGAVPHVVPEDDVQLWAPRVREDASQNKIEIQYVDAFKEARRKEPVSEKPKRAGKDSQR